MTDVGVILDPIADKILTGGALVSLSILGELRWWVTILVLVREFGITALRFAVLRSGSSRRRGAAGGRSCCRRSPSACPLRALAVPGRPARLELAVAGLCGRHGDRCRADRRDRRRLSGQSSALAPWLMARPSRRPPGSCTCWSSGDDDRGRRGLTGGLLVAELIRTPGASAAVLGGVVAYDTDLKHSLLGVDAGLLAEHGPVHAEVARRWRSVARSRLAVRGRAADVGIATTGVAGPDTQGGAAHRRHRVRGPGGGGSGRRG